MLVRDTFAKDINRYINGVVKVEEREEGGIRQELEEYVVTRELQKHFARFLQAYTDGLDRPTDRIGVWISGFFGSGKSHFLKMLSYLLDLFGILSLSIFKDLQVPHDVKNLKAIIGTPISPELTPNKKGKIAQKTEEKIGKYDLNDFFLYHALRYGYAPDKVVGLAMAAYPEIRKPDMKEAAMRFYRRFFSQQFKRSCMPDGPKVGSIDLSPRGDWHMPSDAAADLWLEIIKNC